MTPLGRQGAAEDGENYYEVKTNSKDTDLDGCYEKINFHSVHPHTWGTKYPIYKQTSGLFYLKINEDPTFSAQWIFTNKPKNITYR